jgi:long-chain acyl-CoA synthetase
MELLPTTRISHHYGLTEASRAAFIEYHSDADRLDSIGKASPNVEIAIVDEENHPLPDGDIGEIAVRGPMVMQYYWKQPELTRKVMRNGWLHTGDLGRRLPDGYLYLAGRKDDVINVAGKKVIPEEVEAAINEHPSVTESAVVSMPDPQGLTGQCIKACLVLRNDVLDEELVGWLRGRLEEHKIPRVWQRVERIAKTPSGKIQRHLM